MCVVVVWGKSQTSVSGAGKCRRGRLSEECQDVVNVWILSVVWQEVRPFESAMPDKGETLGVSV